MLALLHNTPSYFQKKYLKLQCIFILSIVFSNTFGATYYSKISSGTDANSLTNWSLNSDGTGGAPASWANTFVIQSAHTMSMSGTWGNGSASMNVTINSGGSLNLNGQILSSTMSTLTINGTGNSSAGAIYNGSATTATIQEDIILASNTTITATSGDMTISGGIATAGFTITFSGTNDYSVSGVISGTGSVTITSTAEFVLSSANTYSGLTTVNNNTSGVLTVSDPAAFGTTAAGLTITSGTVTLTNNITIAGESLDLLGTINSSGNNSWTGNITLVNTGGIITSESGAFTISGDIDLGSHQLTIQGASTSNNTFSGIISGTGSVKKSGGGTWALTNANTFSGGFILHKNTICINHAQALGTGTLTIIQGNPGNLLTLDNTSGASITINSIPISITNNFRFVGTNDLNLGTGNVTLNADITGNIIGGNLTIDGVISGAYAFSKSGVGNLYLTAANTYTGATNVNNGTLIISNAQGTGTTAGGVVVASGATLALSGGITVGNEALTINGTGYSTTGALRNLSGNNSWAGAITLSTNATRINSDANTLTLSNTITNAAIDLTMGGSGDIVAGNVIGNGAGAFTKDGSGTVYLNATNTYTGATTVNGGAVILGANQSLSNHLTINSGTFDVTASNYSLALTGNFTNNDVFNSRNGTVTLNGSSSQSIAGSVDPAFYNLTMNNSSTGATLGLNTSISNTLNFNDGNLSTQGYTLTVGTNGSNGNITNADANKYIIAYHNSGTIGTLRRKINSNTSYSFPIGDNSNYTPISITLNSNGGLSNADISTYTDPSKITQMSSDVSTYLNRHWVNTETGITSPDYDLAYTYVAGDVTGTEADLLPVNFEGIGNWQKPTGSAFTNGTAVGAGSVNTGTKSLSWTGVSNLRKLTAAGNGAVALPVTFIKFSAVQHHNSTILEWSTSSETNNHYFNIEKSVDGIHFETIGMINGLNHSNSIQQYTFNDYSTTTSDICYYRLKQVDLNNQYSYSETISLQNNITKKEIIGLFNLEGQRVNHDYKGIVILIFNDGTTSKVIR